MSDLMLRRTILSWFPMPTRRACRWAMLGLLLLLLGSASGSGQQPPPVLLVLGDSLSAGTGASDPARLAYAPLVREALRAGGRNLEVINLAAPAETTATFLGTTAATGGQGAQLERALALLQTRQVEVIVLSIGANDLLSLIAPGEPCDLSRARSPADLRAAFEAAGCRTAVDIRLLQVRTNLTALLTMLAEAKPASASLLVMLYYNPFHLGLDPAVEALTDENTRRLNAIIRDTAETLWVPAVDVVDLQAAFAGREAQLTHAVQRDVHPNDLGYRVIAGAVLRALPAGVVGFFSAAPSGEASCPARGRWQVIYWRGISEVPLSAVSVLCPLADRFWVNRQGRWLAHAPSLPVASDVVALLAGEAVFAHGGP